MKKEYTINDWEEFLDKNCKDPFKKKEILSRVNSAFKHNVPVILDLHHLAQLLGFKTGIISSMIYSSETFYRTFEIPKKKGGVRKIVAPQSSLIECQKWINQEILSQFIIHECAYAYRKELNIIKNAKNHIGYEYMLKLDLANFFDSITINQVRSLFKQIGYDMKTAYFLSKLCCLNDTLPQGASTSPTISNIVLKNLDNKFEEICCRNDIKYTRYADDLIFSSQVPFNTELVSHFKKTIHQEGFQVNEKKIQFYSPKSVKIVTGLHVSETEVRVPKKTRRKIRQEVFLLQKNGILDQVESTRDLFALERVLGKLYFWKQVEPENKYVLEHIGHLKKLRQELLG